MSAVSISLPEPATGQPDHRVSAGIPDSETTGSPSPVGADWSPFGAVLPVLAGSSGAGASVFAAAAVDVLQRAGRCALLIDTAEPSRSGLSSATEVDGEHATRPAAGVQVRYSWRGHAVLARREPDPGRPIPAEAARLAALPGLDPHRWLPLPPLEPLHATVVDLGGDWARPHIDPGSAISDGALTWLRAARAGAAPRPVLVVRATRPSIAAAETALARLDDHLGSGELVAPAQLVVMASWKKNGWPRQVTGIAGARVSRLLEDAVFIPYDRELDLGGVTTEPCPERVQAVVAGLLDDWGLLPPATD